MVLEVPGSNPGAPTIEKPRPAGLFRCPKSRDRATVFWTTRGRSTPHTPRVPHAKGRWGDAVAPEGVSGRRQARGVSGARGARGTAIRASGRPSASGYRLQ